MTHPHAATPSEALLITAGVLAIALTAAILVDQEDRVAGTSRRLVRIGRTAAYLSTALAAFVMLAAASGDPYRAALAAGCLAPLAGLAETDLRWLLLPNRLVVLSGAQAAWLLAPLFMATGAPATAADLLAAAADVAHGLAGPALGAALGAGLLIAVRIAGERLRGAPGLGLGDVKLAAALGLVLGPLGVVQAIGLGAAAVLVGALTLPGSFARSRTDLAPAAVFPLGAGLAASGAGLALWTALAP
jgi:leader peptidase (prepilin peptidase)/N-methyltransferase